jgi:hypothetical protein
MGTNKPEITEEKVEEINRLIIENPEWNRTRISKQVCELWEWKAPNGQLKDISCRDMLRVLDKKGRIKLPPKMTHSRKAGAKLNVPHLEHDTTPQGQHLREMVPLEIEVVGSGSALDEFKSLIDQYHYLGFDRTVGENMKYIVKSRQGVPLACLLFGSAAWACAGRDKYIGWDNSQRKAGLPYITNNTRFLILPWVTVVCLASHILGLIARRISRDWDERYGHPVYCLETYVEYDRFEGTCYKAANWRLVGRTTGRGRNSAGKYDVQLPKKDVYLYPLKKDFRKMLYDRE